MPADEYFPAVGGAPLMSGDNFTEEEDVSATLRRVALGDLTNRSLKRGISSISDDDENLHLAKQSCKTKIAVNIGDEKASDSSATIETSKEAPNLLNLVTRDSVTKSFDEIGDGSRDSCASTGSYVDVEGRLSGDVKQKNPAFDVCTSIDKDLGFTSSLCGGSKLPNSQGFKSLDRCSSLKGDGCANSGAGPDLLKACNCSFCMKAAYIWSDLHYQDIKGRIASLKKSKKEVSLLANKHARGKQTDTHSNKSSNLESDLTAQWKSLFHRMEDMFVHESNQLQAGYVALKDLRENCKMDLEKTTFVPSNKF